MSTVANVITDIRVNLDDVDSTRFTSDTTIILPLIKKALRRAENIAIRKGLEFVKTRTTLTLLEDAKTVALPALFKRDIAMYYDYAEVPKRDNDYFERCSSGTMWRVNGANAEFKTAATADTDYIFWYFPYIDFSAYAVGTTMPWDGKLDDIIIAYVTMRLLNLDEYDANMELELLADMETNILETYGPITAMLQESDGYSKI